MRIAITIIIGIFLVSSFGLGFIVSNYSNLLENDTLLFRHYTKMTEYCQERGYSEFSSSLQECVPKRIADFQSGGSV